MSVDTVYLLLDYGNLPEMAQSRAISTVILELVESLPTALLEAARAVDVRVYHGWYRETALTQQGQMHAALMANEFPLSFRPTNVSHTVTVRAVLSEKLLASPSTNITHTVRERRFQRIPCRTPTQVGCTNNPCAVLPIRDFLHKERCPDAGCSRKAADFLNGRLEQKLVDTMITADAIYIASKLSPLRVVIASSDDDVWPAILSVVSFGAPAMRIRIKPHQQTPASGAYSLALKSHPFEEVDFGGQRGF